MVSGADPEGLADLGFVWTDTRHEARGKSATGHREIGRWKKGRQQPDDGQRSMMIDAAKGRNSLRRGEAVKGVERAYMYVPICTSVRCSAAPHRTAPHRTWHGPLWLTGSLADWS